MPSLRIPFSLRGLFIASGVIALGLPAAIAGLFGIIQHLEAINADVAIVRNAQLSASAMVQYAQDEEIGIRGLAATRKPAYEADYVAAYARLRIQGVKLRSLLVFADDAPARAALDDALSVNETWRVTIAEPVVQRRRNRLPIAAGRPFVERYRGDIERVNAVLSGDYADRIAQRTQTIAVESAIGFGAIALIAVQALVFAILVARLRYALDRERGLAEMLHAAFAGSMTTPPSLEVGTAYVSATRGAKVGGDVYDVYAIDADSTLLVIADVSGKGVEAAVDTTFVKYAMRAFAAESADIATIVAKFNALYARAEKPPEAFISLFAGRYDRRDGSLRYVNAGHEAAYVRRPADVERLRPTDSIVGIARDAEFHAASTTLGSDDVLFLATDGLTEARDANSAFLGDAGVHTWLRESPATTPQTLVDAISERLRRYTRARLNDDLAILAVTPRAGEAPSGSNL
ncbi:MAG: PP2C family protein-serine/threonine phosphatase [Candidatus Velthaea sp.]